MVGRVLLAGLLAIGLLFAQGKGKSRDSGSTGDVPMPRAQAKSIPDEIADKLKLNKEQKDEVLNILNAASESAGQIARELANGRVQIVQAMVQGQDNSDDYKKLTAAYTAALARMDSLEATTYSKIYGLLKPNQQKNAEQVFAEVMPGMFMRAGGGRGARRGQ